MRLYEIFAKDLLLISVMYTDSYLYFLQKREIRKRVVDVKLFFLHVYFNVVLYVISVNTSDNEEAEQPTIHYGSHNDVYT